MVAVGCFSYSKNKKALNGNLKKKGRKKDRKEKKKKKKRPQPRMRVDLPPGGFLRLPAAPPDGSEGCGFSWSSCSASSGNSVQGCIMRHEAVSSHFNSGLKICSLHLILEGRRVAVSSASPVMKY